MRRLALAFVSLALGACGPLPQRAGIPTVWYPSPNEDDRMPDFVILHHTSDESAQVALAVLTDPVRAVSAHYLVARDGTIFQLVDERKRAWHAGVSRWGAQVDVNSASIGIELDNDGVAPYPAAQVAALLALLADLETRYRIPGANFLGHGDVAPGRKVDPGANFPWRTLAADGFGLWCDPPYPAADPSFDAVTDLQAFGYDVTDPDAAIRAFKRHFGTEDGTAILGEEEAGRLRCLVEQVRQPGFDARPPGTGS